MTEKTVSIIGGGNKEKRSKSDFYPTPPEVTEALLDFLKLPTNAIIWEPACGDGDMVRVLEAHGLDVNASDIRTGTDFLTCDPVACDWIITNPPFSCSADFIRRCVQIGKPFALLLKSQYWHAAGRYDLFKSNPPKFVLPLTWRPDFDPPEKKEQKKKAGKRPAPPMDVMWCVWLPGSTFAVFEPLKKPKKEEAK